MDDLEERRRQLETAIAEEWEYELRESPELALEIGDYRYNDRWSDYSLDHIKERRGDLAAWLSRFEAIDPTGFSEQEDLNRVLMVRNLREHLEEIELKTHEMPIDQLEGIHLLLAEYATLAPFESVEHHEQYATRLRAIPRVIAQIIEVMRQGERDGLMPPRHLLEKTVSQCEAIAAAAGTANPFARPALRELDSLPAGQRVRLHDQVVSVVDEQVRPAYQALARFIAEEYAPKGREEAGVWSLPDGEARYRFAIRQWTTTDLDPEQIHALGLEEVARIEAEQTVIAKKLGFSDLRSFRESLKSHPRLIPRSREEVLDTYRRYMDQMKPELPKLFGLLPTTPLEVLATQDYRENESPGGEYWPGTPDGSRPGRFYVNTGDLEKRSLMEAESTAYHEALPGHHLQVSIAQSLPGLPPFRQHAGYGAYIEGWALYAEQLGKELGFYQNPYSDFGRLSCELLRAVRLVVDTGVHHKRWTRERMVSYFREHSSQDEPDIQIETDRYIVLPAQALSYKVGQLQILRLRDRAERRLGDGFDIRRFHDRILDGGALPLDVLERRVEAWIEASAGASAGAVGWGAG